MILRNVNCKKCRFYYQTQESISTCPHCGHSNGGEAIMALIAIVLVVVFATLMGGLFALIFYSFLWLFGLNKKVRIILGLVLGLIIGFGLTYIMMFKSGVVSDDLLPIAIMAVGGGFSYYYLYNQYKAYGENPGGAVGHTKLRLIILGLLIVGAVVTYYFVNSKNTRRRASQIQDASTGVLPTDGKSEDYSGTSAQTNESVSNTGNETTPGVKDNLEVSAVESNTKSEIPFNGRATVKSERAYFYKDDKLTQRKAYLVSGESFEYTDSDGEFIFVRFTNAQGIETKGWIRVTDCSSIVSE